MKIFARFLLFLSLACASFAGSGSYLNATLSNSAALVKASPSGAQVYFLSVNASNAGNSAAATYLQFFDAATAGAVTVGSTTPLFVLAIPNGGVLDKDLVKPYAFALGIVVAATTTPTGGSAPSTSIPISIFYE